MKIRFALRLAGMIIIPFLLVLAPMLIGQRYGIIQSEIVPDLQRLPVGSVTGASFALLAFLLAFTFQIAANRFEARKKLFLDEVTNIRTTYLRAELLPEPFLTEIRKLIVEYVNLRVELHSDISQIGYAMTRSGQILESLWKKTTQLTKTDLSPAIFSLFASSLNNVIDNYNHRITWTIQYRIPPMIFWVLFFVTFFCMLVIGYQFGVSGKGDFWVFILLALIFATVIFLILVLDNPRLSRLNQKPLLTLQRQIK
jgi:ABC-type multidrug transport system fused ATPase/permease subunit